MRLIQGILGAASGARALGGTRALAAAAVMGAALLFPSGSRIVHADPPAEVTQNDFITGTMNIDFNTRTNMDTSGDLVAGSPAAGQQDVYAMNLTVGKTTVFGGTINRQPTLYSKVLKRVKQPAQLFFQIDLSVLNPADLSQKKTVGKWAGTVPIDVNTGVYDLAGGKASESPLRISVDAVGRQAAFTDPFSGKLLGKAQKKQGLASYTYKRLIGDKETSYTAKKVDPMHFQNVELAKGPSDIYPHCLVDGRLDYDYETGNWLTDGITFTYTVDGAEITDKMTGSIKWVEDPSRKTNGKGHYEFNLRYNEASHKPAAGEGAAFEKMNPEEAFFAVDNSIPALTGTIDYVDSFIDNDPEKVSASKVIYHLNANKLNKQQAMNFFKLWMLAVGPTNDE